MYDHLYEVLADGDVPVEVVVHENHPTLNRRVAQLLAGGERLDVISTHSKYAPSQARWLHPLEHLVDPAAVASLAPASVDLCRFEGQAFCLPRLIDVRILWARTDRIGAVPDTWHELVDGTAVFGFPGRESGLFGTFFELVVGAGGRLFGPDGAPTMHSVEAEMAVDTCAVSPIERRPTSPTGTTTKSTGPSSTAGSMRLAPGPARGERSARRPEQPISSRSRTQQARPDGSPTPVVTHGRSRRRAATSMVP
jgi:hypothetical protein